MRSDGSYDRCRPATDGSTTNAHETFMRSTLSEGRTDPRS